MAFGQRRGRDGEWSNKKNLLSVPLADSFVKVFQKSSLAVHLFNFLVILYFLHDLIHLLLELGHKKKVGTGFLKFVFLH